MGSDATFSNVINESDFEIVHKPLVVPYVQKKEETEIQSDEPLKFDI